MPAESHRRRGPEGPPFPRSDRLLRGGLTALLIFAPLAFGSVEPWSAAVLTWGVSILALAWLLRESMFPEESRAWRRRCSHLEGATGGLLLPAFLMVLLALLQALPIGEELTGFLSPESAGLYEIAGLDGEHFGISVHRGETLLAASRLITTWAIFFLVVNLFRDRRAVRRLTVFLVASGAAMALFGIVQKLNWNGKIYWLRSIPADAVPFGPFVNGNHFAALAAMLSPLTVGWFLSRPRERWPALLAFCLFAASVLMTRSRGGTLSFLFGLFAMGLILFISERTRREGAALLCAGIAGGAYFLLFMTKPLLNRFENIGSDVRLQIWGDTLEIARDFPFFGSGLGTLPQMIERYRTFGGDPVMHAHSDWLQALAEGGAALVLLCSVALFLYVREAAGFLRRRRDQEALLVGAGALAGVAAFLAHSAVDYPFRIPADAVWFTAVAALALATISSSRSVVCPHCNHKKS